MSKFYDAGNNRLVFYHENAQQSFWEKHWAKTKKNGINYSNISPFDYILNITKKHLPKGTKVLEGGCGLAENVFKLQKSGYDSYGIDFAEETINEVRKSYPDLKLFVNDVKSIQFDDNTFDGYWSPGVIEHFSEGYTDIVSEMHRVLKPGGYAFVSFPHMSKYRQKKAEKGRYSLLKDFSKENFYQFALDKNKVVSDFEKAGFNHIKTYYRDGFKGFKDEVKSGTSFLNRIYNNQNPLIRSLILIFNCLFSRYYSHIAIAIFKK